MSEYLSNDPTHPVGLLPVAAPVYPADAHVLQVGADKQFTTIKAAVAAARDGDVILVDAGTYTNDFVRSTAKITVIGVGGMVNMVATVPCADHKAIWTSTQDLNLQNFTFSGAKVSASDGGNGAGIRYEGGRLVLTNDAFLNNQNGIMGGQGAPGTVHEIIVDHCLFSANGSGSGNTHNVYVGAVDNFTATNSIFEKANVGHELKSRALQNTITNNWFRDGTTGTASYDIDLPNGGVSLIRNNVIEKGAHAQNNSMVHYGGEGLPWADSSLLVEGNTFINDKNSSVSGVLNQSGLPITIQNNVFQKIGSTLIVKGPATTSGNVDGFGKPLANVASTDPVPGSTTTYLDAAPHSVTLGGSTKAVRGGTGHLTAFAQGGHVVTIGGSGGVDFTEAKRSGANQITTLAGSTNTLKLTGGDTVDSRGNDTITSDVYNTNGTVSGTAKIDTSTSDQWMIKGTGTATINGRNTASPFVTVMSGGQLNVTGQLLGLHLTNLGGTAAVDSFEAKPGGIRGGHIAWSVSGGSSSSYIWQGVSHITTVAGQQGSTVQLGDGRTEVLSFGKDTIYAGTADANVILGGGGAELHAGTGKLAVFGRHLSQGNEAKVYGNGGTYTFGGDSGNIIYYGGDNASTVNLNVSFMTLIGGAGLMTVAGGSVEKIVGGSGGLDYTAGPGGSASITTAAGSTNVLRLDSGGGVDSWGNDTITGGHTNDSITVHGNATISGGTGMRVITLMGQDSFTHGGSAVVNVTAGANATVDIAGRGNIDETGATVRIATDGAFASSAVLTGGQASAWTSPDLIKIVTAANVGTDVALDGPATTATLQGADTLHAGTGTTTVYVNAAGATIDAGSGTMNLRGSVGGMTFIGGNGETAMLLYGGNDDVVFGSGNTTVNAQGGLSNTFEFRAGQGGGTDIIQGFRVGVDHLSLSGVTVASQAVANNAANIVLSDNTQLQLAGVTDLSKLWS